MLETQKRLAALDGKNAASGIQLTSHLIGSVINIGTFSIIAAALPHNADIKKRSVAAISAMRGMNSSILWSPFFISFAVASIYLPDGFAMGAISLGALIAAFFLGLWGILYYPIKRAFKNKKLKKKITSDKINKKTN